MALLSGVITNQQQPCMEYTYTQNKTLRQTTLTLVFKIKRTDNDYGTYKNPAPYEIQCPNNTILKSGSVAYDIRPIAVGSYFVVASVTKVLQHDASGYYGSITFEGLLNLSGTSVGGTITTGVGTLAIPNIDVTPAATTGTIVLGNIYRDGINARIENLVSGYSAVRTFTWYYKKHSDSTYIQVPNAVTTLASGATATVSEWCTQTRGLLAALTSYDIRCIVTFSNGAPTLTLTATATTTDDKFDIVVSRANDLVILVPQITIPFGSKVSVFKALDNLVRADLEADVWQYITTKVWEDVANPNNQLLVDVVDDYTLYDFKIVITDANKVITNIIFMED